MKVRIHKVGADGGLGEPVSDLMDREVANQWMIDQMQTKALEGGPTDYVAQPYDNEGHPVEKVSEEEADKAAEDAVWLTSHDPEVETLLHTMIHARQMYVVAATEMDKHLAKVKIKDGETERDPAPFTQDMLFQSASHHGSQQFDERTLYVAMEKKVMPWFKKLVENHFASEMESQRQAMLAYDKQRRATTVPAAFSCEKGGPRTISRGQTTAIGGDVEAVRYLLRQSVNEALADRCDVVGRRTVLWLTTDEVKPHPDDDVHLVRVPVRMWADCAKTRNSWPKFVSGVLAELLSAMPDLVVIDNLLLCNSGLHSAAKSGMLAADANRNIMTWCRDDVGAALLVGIPTPDRQPLNVMGYDWQRFREFATVRPLTVEELPDGSTQSRIIVGTDADEIIVNTAVLAPESKIIVPG